MQKDIKYMKEALKEAKKAYEIGEVPIGAVIVKEDKIIARAHNEKEKRQDVTKHAEIIAIQKASKKLNNWRLSECKLYVTLKPCNMCTGAIIQSRISEVIIGTDYLFGGSTESHSEGICNLGEEIKITKGLIEEECKNILKEFFKETRQNKAKK